MKRLFPIALAALVGGTALAEEPKAAADTLPQAHDIEQEAELSGTVADPDTRCSDTIELVRDAQGQPTIDRGPAFRYGIEPVLAVQQKVEGCDVLVMVNGDFRPLPELPDDGSLYFPAQ